MTDDHNSNESTISCLASKYRFSAAKPWREKNNANFLFGLEHVEKKLPNTNVRPSASRNVLVSSHHFWEVNLLTIERRNASWKFKKSANFFVNIFSCFHDKKSETQRRDSACPKLSFTFNQNTHAFSDGQELQDLAQTSLMCENIPWLTARSKPKQNGTSSRANAMRSILQNLQERKKQQSSKNGRKVSDQDILQFMRSNCW